MTALRFYSPQASQLLLLTQQLRGFERAPPEQLQSLQQQHLLALLQHAQQYSQFWRARLQRAGFDAAAPALDAFERLPILTRAEVQDHGDALRAPWPGLQDKHLVISTSSGSTGQPVRIAKDARIYGPLYSALTWIESQWHARDPRGRLAVLNVSGNESANASWGGVFELMGLRGPSTTRLLGSKSFGEHLDWLVAYQPDYLKCSPVVATELALLALERGVQLPLRQIISQWERVAPRHRQLCREAFGATIVDRYSCEEAGWLALQCPSHGNMHVLSASVLIEIVDERGRPCPPGLTGRVLLTSLHNRALPLLRYELGDLAQWGPPCACGMTLPVLAHLQGRTRQQARLPDGSRIAMAFLGDDLGLLPAIREFRIYQYRGGELEILIRSTTALTPSDHAEIRAILARSGTGALPLFIRRVAAIEWEPGRKREEFMQLDQDFVAAPGA